MKNEIDKTIWEAYKDFYGALTVHEDMRNVFEKGLKCFPLIYVILTRIMLII